MTENDARPEPVLIVGAVTWDVVQGASRLQRVPGGSATFAARTATALGVQAHVLILAGDDANLDAFAGHHLTVARAERTMTLEHRFEDGRRHQRVLAHPGRTLRPSDLPSHWPPSYTMIIGPLVPDDMDVMAFLDLPGPDETAVIAQGIQRRISHDGTMHDLDVVSAGLFHAARPNVALCLSAEETDRWPDGSLEVLVRRAVRVVRTLGAEGAEIRTARGTHHIAPLPAEVVDTTGAGDVFATALILAMRAGEDVAGRLAAACAAACMERRGSAPLPARSELEARAGITPGASFVAQGDRS